MSLTTVDQDRRRQTFSPKSSSSSETPTTPTDFLLPQSNDTQEAQKDIRTYFLPATSKNVPREDIRIYFLPAESFKNNNQRGKSKPPLLKTNEKPNHVVEEITEPPPALFQEWKAPVYPPPRLISASKLPRTAAPKPKSPPPPPQKPQETFQNRTTTLTDNKHHLIKFRHLEPILSPDPTNNNPDLPPTPPTPPSPQSPHHFDLTLIPPPLRPHPPSFSSSSPSSQKQQQQQSPLLPGHHHPTPLPLKHLDIITVGPTPTSVTPAAKARFEEWHRSQLARSNHFSLSISPSNTVPLPRPVPPSDHPSPTSTPEPILSRQHDDDHRFNRANNTTSPRSHIPPVEPQPWTPQPTVAAVPSSSSSSCSSKNPHFDSARAPMSIPRKKVPLSHHHYHHFHQQQYQQYQQHQQHRRNDTMPNARSPPPTLVAAGGESDPDGFSGAMWPEPARCRSLETFARWPYSPASPPAPHPPLPPPVPPRRDLPVLEMSRMRFEEGEDDGRGWEDWGSGSGGGGEWEESASESGGGFEGRRKDKGGGKEPKRTRIVRFLEGYSKNVEGLSMIQ